MTPPTSIPAGMARRSTVTKRLSPIWFVLNSYQIVDCKAPDPNKSISEQFWQVSTSAFLVVPEAIICGHKKVAESHLLLIGA